MRRGFCFLVAPLSLGLLCALALPARAAEERVSPAEYTGRLERAIEQARGVSFVEAGPERMDEIRGILGLPVVVETAGGAVRIPRAALIGRLEGESGADFDRAVIRLQAALEAARVAESAPILDRERVREDLRAAYGDARSGPGVLERIVSRVLDAWDGFVHSFAGFEGPRTLLSWALLIGVLAGIVFLGRRIDVGVVSERVAGVGTPAGATDWARRADEALARGDLAEAVRCRYHALLQALAARGFLVDSPSLTAGECRSVVGKARPPLYSDVARATHAFERVAYGHRVAVGEDLQAIERAEQAVRST